MSWIVIGCCWATSFLFSGIEAGLLSLDQVRLRHQVKLQNHSAIMLDRLMKEPERLLATILLVTNFADIAGLLVLTRLLVTLLGTIGYPVALLIAAPIYLFLLGVLPKSLFRRSHIGPLLRSPACWFSVRACSGQSSNSAPRSAGSSFAGPRRRRASSLRVKT